MTRVSLTEFRAIRARANEKKAKRKAKAGVLWPRKATVAHRRVRRVSLRQGLKSRIIRLLGLLDRKINGPLCRLGGECPDYIEIGVHSGMLAYHVVPGQRGDSTRFLPENVVWACRNSNFGEVMNRSLYREKHVMIFGREYVEAIEAKAREIKHFTVTELRDLLAQIKTRVEAK